MTSMITGWFWPGIVALIGAAAGGFLLIRGLHGRRMGDAPHCRKCDYNLTGTRANRCSECGAELDPAAIVQGVRHRRVRLLTLGAVLLVGALWLGAVSGRRMVRSVNWYPYYPTSWLLTALGNDQFKALVEVDRRLHSGRLSEQEFDGFLDTLLALHGRQPPPGNLFMVTRTINKLALEDVLSAEQIDRYLSGLFQLEIRVPEQVRAGHQMTLTVHCAAKAGFELSQGFTYWHGIDRITIGTAAVDFHGKEEPFYSALMGLPSADARDCQFTVPEDTQLGNQTVTYVAVHGIKARPWQPDAPFIWSQTVSFQKAIVVLPSDAPAPIEWIDDPSLEGELLGVFEGIVVATTYPRDASRFHVFPEWHKHARPLPVPVAFEVFLRIDGVDHPAGEWAFDKSGQMCARSATLLSPFDASEGEVILRASEEVAQRWCQLPAIWKGELNLGTLPLPEIGDQQ